MSSKENLTFNWNIINNKKSKQNITRDIEIKNNVTIARGECGGRVGRGYTGATIKDTRTKSRRRVEVGEGGGTGWGGVEG